MSSIYRSDPALLTVIEKMFTNAIAFNAVCGFEVDLQELVGPRIHFDMRDELVGNFRRGNLHGGVISSALDVTGGLIVLLDIANRMPESSEQHLLERFEKMGTIDMRVDYLRPGLGKRFTAGGNLLRNGRKVAVTRMELHNEENDLIAVGTGSYVVS